ncbi:MAG: T9SS C-terminal target domain-containing protein, partial [Ignavibacteria bacterium]|nr:T9SS C-terminal target domain-containing protein [Ignavibacteria bacterium]
MKLHNLFLMLSFTQLFVTNIFGQAAVDILLSATDGTLTYEFSVGLDLNATNCIDTIIGECGGDPPPIPPVGIFDIRIDLAPYGCGLVFACKDYRPPGNPPTFPFTGTIEHTLWYQTSSFGTNIYITYNLSVGTQMYIRDQIGGSFLNIGPFSGQGVATIPGSYTAIFSKALLIMQYNNIVPVELTSFTASIIGDIITLNWQTETELNNQGFEIEKQSESENRWETIGFVPGYGTTTEPTSYSFIDKDITTGTYKYRLKQLDYDGSFNHSNEIEVQVNFTPKELRLYQNYPNPFNPNTTISWQSPVTS